MCAFQKVFTKVYFFVVFNSCRFPCIFCAQWIMSFVNFSPLRLQLWKNTPLLTSCRLIKKVNSFQNYFDEYGWLFFFFILYWIVLLLWAKFWWYTHTINVGNRQMRYVCVVRKMSCLFGLILMWKFISKTCSSTVFVFKRRCNCWCAFPLITRRNYRFKFAFIYLNMECVSHAEKKTP